MAEKKNLVIEPTLEKLDELQSEIYSCLSTYEEIFSKKYKDTTPYFMKGKKLREKILAKYYSKE